MSGCLDRVDCDCDCECREKAADFCKKSRNVIASIIAGTLVSISLLINSGVNKTQYAHLENSFSLY